MAETPEPTGQPSGEVASETRSDIEPDTVEQAPSAGSSSAAHDSPRESDRTAASGGFEERPSVIDAIADLLQFVVDWLRQEAEAAMREKVVLPLQRLGLTLASAVAAACLAVLGITFISTGVFILLGEWMTYPGALLLIGGILLVGAVIFTVIKMKGIQR